MPVYFRSIYPDGHQSVRCQPDIDSPDALVSHEQKRRESIRKGSPTFYIKEICKDLKGTTDVEKTAKFLENVDKKESIF